MPVPVSTPGMDAGGGCPRALQGRKANQAYTAFHGERGQFGMDAEIRTHQALSMDAYKWSNKVGMQGSIKSVSLNRCTMQRHKRLTRQ